MNLEEKYGRKYRVFIEDAYKAETTPNKSADKWRYMELRGKYGYVYPYSSTQLAFAVTSSKLAPKLSRRAGWKTVQNADDVTVFFVPDEDVNFALSTLKLFRRRIVSEETRAKMAATLEKARAAKKK